MLKTSRSQRFLTETGLEKARKNITDAGIDGLLVIGGNGSLRGAHCLASYNIPIVGIPATIDNDITGVDKAIGVDTAVNVAVDAVDKIRDTATSLERIFVVEVMGRQCGYLALMSGIATGAEMELLPEDGITLESLIKDVKRS
jgi:6-phosphofructokinase 1